MILAIATPGFVVLGCCMAYLVLDLDKSTFILEKKKKDINAHHTLSGVIPAPIGRGFRNITVISPEKLIRLLASASDGIIVLTAGYWKPGVIPLLYQYLATSFDVPEGVEEKLNASFFTHQRRSWLFIMVRRQLRA